ncbi:hypothetical protein [Hymenobacter elongatus]|uniref:Uncharacterized protein n=1 Tax=Hymenobacter elongatus TaxID=877208 RepID=A0A4Z0PLD7_9BACT|nr:hypothetical protein [Hymenobacter elongatus]TGE16835.1 hypothetical protein E5J99_08995 [Hymenobacter elongatus]
MRFTSSFHALVLFLVVALLASCQKDAIDTTGSVAISFTPVINADVPDSYYCSVHVAETYPNTPPLARKYVADFATQIDGTVRVTFDHLNPGDYIFTYYKNRQLVPHSVQVASQKTTTFTF